MASIDFARMTRIATRLLELADDPAVKPLVKSVFDDRTRGPINDYLAANAAIAGAESAARKEGREADDAFAKLDQPYREARAVAAAYLPAQTLPETLKSLPTDTDRKNAIETLLDAIDDHAGESWADQILAHAFGQSASQVVQELNESIAASTALSAARDARAKAFGLAYERYVSFKNVVRNSYGSKSPQYRRIHLRTDGTVAAEGTAEPTLGGTPTE